MGNDPMDDRVFRWTDGHGSGVEARVGGDVSLYVCDGYAIDFTIESARRFAVALVAAARAQEGWANNILRSVGGMNDDSLAPWQSPDNPDAQLPNAPNILTREPVGSPTTGSGRISRRKR